MKWKSVFSRYCSTTIPSILHERLRPLNVTIQQCPCFNSQQKPMAKPLLPLAICSIRKINKVRSCSYNGALLLSLAHKTQLTNLCSASLYRAESVTLLQVVLSKTKALNKKLPLCDDLLTHNLWHIIRKVETHSKILPSWSASDLPQKRGLERRQKGNCDHGSRWPFTNSVSLKLLSHSLQISKHSGQTWGLVNVVLFRGNRKSPSQG